MRSDRSEDEPIGSFSVVDAIIHPLLLVDAQLRVAYANTAFCRLFCCDPRDIEGQPIAEFGGGAQRRIVEETVAAMTCANISGFAAGDLPHPVAG